MTDKPKATVFLDDVVDGMDMQSDESSVLFDPRSGEFFPVSDYEVQRAESDDDLDDLEDWERKERETVRRLLEEGIAVPDRFEIHEWEILRDFSRSRDDAVQRDELLDAIRGRGAFRMFKSAVHRLGIQDDWYDYRQERLREIARDWLDANGIPYSEEKRHAREEPDSDS